MGGRGGSSGISAGGGFSALAQSTKGRWDYRGNSERIDRLESALNNARSVSKVNAVANQLNSLDKNITAEINRIQQGYVTDGDITALMAQRRRIRQLKSKARI